MFGDTVSITIGSIQRTYARAWVPEFAKVIAAGNTAVRKWTNATDEVSSVFRVSHEGDKSGVARHVFQIIDDVVDEDGIQRRRRVHLVIEHDKAVSELAPVKTLALGLAAAIDSATVDSILGNSL